MRPSGFIEVRTTTADRAAAEALAEALVAERLAACVHLWPVASMYRWDGEVTKGEEHVLSIRARADRFGAVRDRILALHAYEVPEIVALPIVDGAPAYLAWLAEADG